MMVPASEITILVNGRSQVVPYGLTVAELLVLLQLNPRFLAVERNRELVPRRGHAEVILAAGDELEIVTLVGGG
jgi:thiamine biosynthesis protein ThiS